MTLTGSVPATAALTSQNPWPGLRAFTESEHEFFFGREREAAELLELIERAAVVVLFGQSGLGKTSLIQAGLFPELKRRDFFGLRLRFDYSEDAPPLAEQIKQRLTEELDRAAIKAPRAGRSESLWEYFHRRDVDFWGPGNRLLTPVIVFDQFEEVFTLGQRNPAAAARVAQLAADMESVLEHRPPEAVRRRLDDDPDEALRYDFHRQGVRFLISLREDFLAYLDPLRERIPSLLSSRFRLEPMTATQALDVVQRGGRDLVDQKVAQDIVDFVADSRRRVAPALLSVVLDELNHRRVQRGESRITAEFLSGERGKIIQYFYERSFEGIEPRVRAWVEDRLLTASGHRQSAALEDALAHGLPLAAFDSLVDRRALHRVEREGVVWIELTHNLLCEPARRSRDERDQRQKAEESAKERARYRRQLRRSRVLAGVFGGLLVAAAALLIVAVRSTKEAEQAERHALQSRTATIQLYGNEVAAIEQLTVGVGPGSWVPVATAEQAIAVERHSYEQLAAVAGKTDSGYLQRALAQQHAEFLASAVDALDRAGHFSEGAPLLAEASQQLALMPESDPQNDFARAETLFDQGVEATAMGKSDDAITDFEKALTFAAAVPKSDPNRADALDLYIRSEDGLGEVYSSKSEGDKAESQYQAALQRAQLLATQSAAAKIWEVQPLLDLGAAERVASQGQSWYGKAETALDESRSSGLNDTRWVALSSSLEYQEGLLASNLLHQYDEAESMFDKVVADLTDLSHRDPNNVLGQLMLARTREQLGLIHARSKDWGRAQSLFGQAQEVAMKLSEQQPAWVSPAALLRDLQNEQGLVFGSRGGARGSQ